MSESELRKKLSGGGNKSAEPAADDAAGGSLRSEEQRRMRHTRRRGGAARPEESAPDYRFGGDFWVVVQQDDGSTRIANVKAGLTDLDRVEIISGLDENQRVLILPSAHLVETQEQLQRWINRRVGNVPGIETR